MALGLTAAAVWDHKIENAWGETVAVKHILNAAEKRAAAAEQTAAEVLALLKAQTGTTPAP